MHPYALRLVTVAKYGYEFLCGGNRFSFEVGLFAAEQLRPRKRLVDTLLLDRGPATNQKNNYFREFQT